jgi:hypothetical protein
VRVPEKFRGSGAAFDQWKQGTSPRSRLYHNNGDGTFTDVSAGSGLDHTGWGMGVCVGDYDNDGFDDLYVTYYGGNVLYHNNGNGTFTEVAYRAGLGEVGWLFTTFGAKFLDYDNDGWKDIMLADGQVFPQIDRYQTGITYAERNLLFHNRGDGTFDEVGLQSGPGFALRKVSRGLATADYDNDGDLEILVSNMNGAPDLLRHLRKNPNHSILVKTIGSKSNRDGIGAEVKVTAGSLTQYDTVRSGGSYLSSSDLRLHFGLGNRTTIDRLEVRWPSGETQKIENPPVDRILVIKEGEGLVATQPLRKAGVSAK